MLSKAFRLPFSEFRTRGYRTFATPYFSLKVRSNVLPKDRIGVIISVAAVKSAVRRNFWKRQAKAVIGKWQMANGKFDVLVIFSKKGDSLTNAEFRKELQKARSAAMRTFGN